MGETDVDSKLDKTTPSYLEPLLSLHLDELEPDVARELAAYVNDERPTVWDDLPWPLASLFHEWFRTVRSLRTHSEWNTALPGVWSQHLHRGVSIVDVVVRLLCSTLLCGQAEDPRIIEQAHSGKILQLASGQSTLGTSMDVLRELARLHVREPADCIIPELPPALWGQTERPTRLHEILDALVWYRNKIAHCKTPQGTELPQARSTVEALERVFAHLIAGLGFLARYRLVCALSQGRHDREHRGVLHLKGKRRPTVLGGPLGEIDVPAALDWQPGHVYLVGPDKGAKPATPLSLHPLVLFQASAEMSDGGVEYLWFYEKRSGKKNLVYQCQDGPQVPLRLEAAAELRHLIGRALDGAHPDRRHDGRRVDKRTADWSWSELMGACESRLTSAAAAFVHDELESVYVRRKHLEDCFWEFIRSDRSGMIVVGDSGLGKSTLFRHLCAQVLEKDQPALFLDCNGLPLEEVQRYLEVEFAGRTGQMTLAEVDESATQRGLPLVVVFDAINEFAFANLGPVDLMKMLHDFIRRRRYPALKFVLTMRPSTWDACTSAIPLEQVYASNGNEPHRIERFDPGEASSAYTQYARQNPHWPPKRETLNAEVQHRLADPLLLALAARVYRGRPLPESRLSALELFEAYHREVVTGGDSPGDREQAREDLLEGIVACLCRSPVDRVSPAEVREVMDSLAHTDGHRENVLVPALVDLVDMGILRKERVGAIHGYRFAHERYLEFLLSRHMHSFVYPDGLSVEDFVALIEGSGGRASRLGADALLLSRYVLGQTERGQADAADHLISSLAAVDRAAVRSVLLAAMRQLAEEAYPTWWSLVCSLWISSDTKAQRLAVVAALQAAVLLDPGAASRPERADGDSAALARIVKPDEPCCPTSIILAALLSEQPQQDLGVLYQYYLFRAAPRLGLRLLSTLADIIEEEPPRWTWAIAWRPRERFRLRMSALVHSLVLVLGNHLEEDEFARPLVQRFLRLLLGLPLVTSSGGWLTKALRPLVLGALVWVLEQYLETTRASGYCGNLTELANLFADPDQRAALSSLAALYELETPLEESLERLGGVWRHHSPWVLIALATAVGGVQATDPQRRPIVLDLLDGLDQEHNEDDRATFCAHLALFYVARFAAQGDERAHGILERSARARLHKFGGRVTYHGDALGRRAGGPWRRMQPRSYDDKTLNFLGWVECERDVRELHYLVEQYRGAVEREESDYACRCIDSLGLLGSLDFHGPTLRTLATIMLDWEPQLRELSRAAAGASTVAEPRASLGGDDDLAVMVPRALVDNLSKIRTRFPDEVGHFLEQFDLRFMEPLVAAHHGDESLSRLYSWSAEMLVIKGLQRHPGVRTFVRELLEEGAELPNARSLIVLLVEKTVAVAAADVV
jgi:hypothetical protein